MRVTLMGTGTSHGVPVIACDCAVCRSTDERDKRNRCSAFIESGDEKIKTRIVIDTGPEFRVQALRFGVTSLDAVLLTHGHADHLNGLDDLRIFSHTCSADKQNETAGRGLPIYANEKTIKDIHHRFDYVFHHTQLGGGKPKLDIIDSEKFNADKPIQINSLSVIPIPMTHGELQTNGWLIFENNSSADKSSRHSIAYLTDCSYIPESSVSLLQKHGGAIEHLVIDGLREWPHKTHFSFLQAMEAGVKIGANHVWLTHITHNMSHAQIEEYCRTRIADTATLAEAAKNGMTFAPTYDGLVLEV